MRLENKWVLKMRNRTVGNPANPLDCQVPQLLHSWSQFGGTRFAIEKDRKGSFSEVSHLPHIGSYSNYQCNCFKSHLIIHEKGELGSVSYDLLMHQAMQSITMYHTCTSLWIVFWFSFLLDHHFGKSTRKSCGMNIDFRHYRTERRLQRQGEEFFYRNKCMFFKVSIKPMLAITHELSICDLVQASSFIWVT